MRTLITLAFVLALAPAAALGQSRLKMAVLPTQFDESAKGQVPSLFDDYLLTAVQNHATEYEVIGQEDITAMLGFEQQKDLLNCEDTSCMADIGGALGVEKLLVVKVARLSTDWVMTAKIINIKATTVESRVNHMAGGDVRGLLDEVSTLVTKVFGGRRSVDTSTPASESAPSAPNTSSTEPAQRPTSGVSATADTGWAMGAGVLGLVSAGLIAVFTGGAAATTDDQFLSISLGTIALTITAVMTPVTFVGARSAREHPQVNGSLALRVIGWVCYGLAMADGLALLALGLLEIEPPVEAIAIAGVLGASATSSMAIDAFISRAQAKGIAQTASRGSAEGVGFFPWASVRVDPTQQTKAAPILGMGLTF